MLTKSRSEQQATHDCHVQVNLSHEASSKVTLNVVFFSDGMGRTGTFICIHAQLERLKTEGVFDLSNQLVFRGRASL